MRNLFAFLIISRPCARSIFARKVYGNSFNLVGLPAAQNPTLSFLFVCFNFRFNFTMRGHAADNPKNQCCRTADLLQHSFTCVSLLLVLVAAASVIFFPYLSSPWLFEKLHTNTQQQHIIRCCSVVSIFFQAASASNTQRYPSISL